MPQTGIMFVAEWAQSIVGQEVGYYVCVCGCVALGLALMPTMVNLVFSVETLPMSDWRVCVGPTVGFEMTPGGYNCVSSDVQVVNDEHCD